MNSKGVLGDMMTTFVATIVIIVILIMFALISGVVKKVGGVAKGISVPDEKEFGIDDVDYYIKNSFIDLVNFRYGFAKTGSFGRALDIQIMENLYEIIIQNSQRRLNG